MAEREGLFKRLGKGFDRYVGGLLGEDLSSMTPEERAAARRSAIGIIGRGMVSPEGGSSALTNVMQARAMQREREQMRSRAMAAEQEMPRITGRLFGTSGGMIEGLQEGEAPTPLTARYRVNPQEALSRMYGTQAGRDVASVSPELLQLAQEGVTGRTVGGAVYNPLTGAFSRPQEQQVRDLTPQEISSLKLPAGTIAQRKPDGTIDIVFDPRKGAGAGTGVGGGEDYSELRKEWTGLTKDYRAIGSMWSKVLAAGSTPSPANDIALIFGFMKILDPTSVVREGEFATAQNAGNIDQSIRARYNQLIEGKGRLTEEQRQSFLQSAYGAVKSQLPGLKALEDQYTAIASASGLNPRRIIVNPLQGSMLPKITGDNDPNFDALPVGAMFEAPDGSIQRKVRK